MRRQRVVVKIKAGPTWQTGPPEDQPGWDEHAEFVDALIEAGTFVMGGPFSDNSGTLVLLEGITSAEARTLMDSDPFVVTASSRSTRSGTGRSTSTSSHRLPDHR